MPIGDALSALVGGAILVIMRGCAFEGDEYDAEDEMMVQGPKDELSSSRGRPKKPA